MKWLEAMYRLAEWLGEFFRWRDDWNRTWSPVSFWLAVATILPLVLFGVFFFGHEIWRHLVGWIGGTP